jgi:hypothetical protein
VPHEVEIDEPRERLGEGPEVLGLDASEGTDEIGEERAETFLENVTGADDAATEHRSEDTAADEGGPFVDLQPPSDAATMGETDAQPRRSATPAGAGLPRVVHRRPGRVPRGR